GVEFVEQLTGWKDFAQFTIADDLDAFLLEELDPAHHDLFLVELHVGDAIHEQAAWTIGALENGHPMSGMVELSRGAKTGGSGPDDGNLFSSARFGRLGNDPALLPSFVNDGTLDVFDGDGGGVDPEDARAFARGGAD